MKVLVLPFAALVGWAFAEIAFPGSAADCRLIYAIVSAVGLTAMTAAWLWMPHRRTVEVLASIDWFPPQQHRRYHGPSYVDSAWAEGQRERARLMWLDGTPTPPTDWYGDRGR